MEERQVREVFAVSYPRLVTQLLALCGDRASAEDLVQDAFITALTHAAQFEAVANKEAWLRTVALNKLRKQWRHAAVARRFLPRLAKDTEPSLGDSVDGDHVAIVTALRRLAPAAREVVVLHYIADLSVAQIAQELDIAEGTVKARLFRARAQLAPLLDTREPDADPPTPPNPKEADHV